MSAARTLVFRSTRKIDYILPDLEGATFRSFLAPVVAKDAVLVTDGRQACSQFANGASIAHITCVAPDGERVIGSYHVQNVNAYQSRFKGWMAPFKGVASKYLTTYLGCRRMIERDGDRLTPRHPRRRSIGRIGCYIKQE